MDRCQDGRWLCRAGEYQDLVSDLCAADPRLRQRDEKAVRQKTPWPVHHARLVVLECSDGRTFGGPVEYTPQALRDCLESQRERSSPEDPSRVYILEGLHPSFITVLGDRFKMHPSLFTEHERVGVISHTALRESDTGILPAMTRTREHYTMKYFELLRLPQEIRGRFEINCSMTGRHIGVTREKGQFSDVGTLHRKCSVWRRYHEHGQGWDYWNKSVTVLVSPGPFQGGYLDFMPHETRIRDRNGPPRTSMLNDLCFYIQHHAALVDVANPDDIALFAKKIIASHYLQHSQYLRSTIFAAQFYMSRQSRLSLDYFNGAFVEAQ
ncbi:hypothetical protein F5Y19DRAFT_489092 [Xylariaceae sp. FL1651]|nr:hypothetical protein F5Y19DRAFT_489092 [Xylariaceae sp. FL1651]